MIKIKFKIEKRKYVAFIEAKDKKAAKEKLQQYVGTEKIKIKSCKNIYSNENKILIK